MNEYDAMSNGDAEEMGTDEKIMKGWTQPIFFFFE